MIVCIVVALCRFEHIWRRNRVGIQTRRGIKVRKLAAVAEAEKWRVIRPYQKHKTVTRRLENVHFYSFSLCESMNKFALFSLAES